jgi:hypothetical protein
MRSGLILGSETPDSVTVWTDVAKSGVHATVHALEPRKHSRAHNVLRTG